MRQFFFILMIVNAVLCSQSFAEVTARWSSRTALYGEEVLLMIADDSGEGAFELAAPSMVNSGAIEVCDLMTEVNPDGTGTTALLPIRLTPIMRGTFSLPPLEIRYLQSGKTARVSVPPLQVLASNSIQWYNDPIPYGVIWYDDASSASPRGAERELYVGQSCNMGVKILLPMDVNVSAPPEQSIANSGVTTSYFRTPLRGVHDLARRIHLPKPKALAGADEWRTVDYHVTCTPNRVGRTSLAASVHVRPRYGSPHELTLPMLNFSAMDLPFGAPAEFKGCIGQVKMSATTTAEDLSMHTPVEVQLEITGVLNDRQIPEVQMSEPEGWVLSSQTRQPILDAAGNTVGVHFRLVMYPTAEVRGIPAFVVHYFDPEMMNYSTALSEPIGLVWTATSTAGSAAGTVATEAPPAGEVPVEEMKDICGYLPEGSSLNLVLPRWIWYLLYLPAVGILLWLCIGRWLNYRAATADDRKRDKELAALRSLTDGAEFLKRLGAFIESRVPTAQRGPEVQSILQRRDHEVFRPGAAVQLSTDERQSMLRQVRNALSKCATVLLLALLLGLSLPQAQAGQNKAESAYNSAQYTQSLHLLKAQLKNPQADKALTWYNMGNCYYRTNEPGKAALCYSRALLLHPGFPEAQANLDFIMRKQGAILRQPDSATDQIFTLLSSNQLTICTIIATALLALCIALQLLLRGQSRPWLHTVTALALAASLLCALNRLYYSTREVPDFSQLPPENLAWVITATELRSAPDHTAHSAMNKQLAAATPLHLLHVRGTWSQVETMTGTRGWVLTRHIASLSEDGTAPRPTLMIEFR